jgi:hypothetical protein
MSRGLGAVQRELLIALLRISEGSQFQDEAVSDVINAAYEALHVRAEPKRVQQHQRFVDQIQRLTPLADAGNSYAAEDLNTLRLVMAWGSRPSDPPQTLSAPNAFRYLGAERLTPSRAFALLAKRGLVVRRRGYVALTDAGRAMAEALTNARRLEVAPSNSPADMGHPA